MTAKEAFWNKFVNNNTYDGRDWWNMRDSPPEKVWAWIVSHVANQMPNDTPKRNPAANNGLTDEKIVEIVKFAVENGAMEASRKFEIHHGSVYDWCKKLGVKPKKGNQPVIRDWDKLKSSLNPK